MKIKHYPKCNATVSPGDYLIDRWDGKPCTNDHPLYYCHDCTYYYCSMHWGTHECTNS